MGFEHSNVVEAMRTVGPSIPYAVEHILKSSSTTTNTNRGASTTHTARRKQPMRACRLGGQSRIVDHFKFNDVKDNKDMLEAQDLDIASDWEQRVSYLLQKHFGFSSLKSFQKEALAAWVAHKDSVVLAATGAGKSLCFQIPALLSGRVVVVISPLISLMNDQCLKLKEHGISACFLGSGQPDETVELKAMKGMYSIVYVCPETIERLIEPLQELAESGRICLFAIDEVHCVSKWGHDFRPAYSRLAVLRENFNTSKLKSLKFNIPLMALTATATKRVQEDILKSLCMSKETIVVLTSLFRPNLRFMVKHSRTSLASYAKDFHELIEVYGGKHNIDGNEKDFFSDDSSNSSDACSTSDEDIISSYEVDDGQDEYAYRDINANYAMHSGNTVTQEPLEQGPAIIYVPTRKETLRIAEYLCKFGVKAAAYNAGLPKLDLRRVHQEFHENTLQVVVATVAFGMGIDKSNVRRIIHYGWPQSLEAYYQGAGRAGRDGKLADCILHANLASIPSLLPSKQRLTEDRIKIAYILLSDCFRYGMKTSCCRAKTLVEYFGEDFSHDKCLLCDVCIGGPPQRQNLKEEACILLQTIAAQNACSYSMDCSYDGDIHSDSRYRRLRQRPGLKKLVAKIRQQFQKFLTTSILWWRGLARILEVEGYIREGDDKIYVQIKYPELTELGLELVESKNEQAFYVYPEADMLLEKITDKSFSSFSEWGKGWANPEIRRQRLKKMRVNRQPKILHPTKRQRKRKANRVKPEAKTSRGRLAARLSKLSKSK
ncbi:ATP-dependent DNA helicase Q-like SIM [Abrus precatorius]|uniref:ATP-dependent DNA helicase n=1 Tax=Abrus precatorius TaxID=3816 RepID=A0A8B8MGD9_ABRPR|nr:ATP-dependent DNA helicase Q-like SIM [Abrus precatorius]